MHDHAFCGAESEKLMREVAWASSCVHRMKGFPAIRAEQYPISMGDLTIFGLDPKVASL
jgi:hypothetical protein